MRTLRSAHVHDFITSLRLEIPYAMVALEIRYHVVFLQHDDASMRRLAAAHYLRRAIRCPLSRHSRTRYAQFTFDHSLSDRRLRGNSIQGGR